MSALKEIYHIARADFLDRVRSYGFIIVLLITIMGAYVFIPPTDANYITLVISDTGASDLLNGGSDDSKPHDYYRGIYNSAWIGTNVAILTIILLSLFGFYLVKNAVDRDRRTGVGQIIAASPVTKTRYILGKALSNFSVFSVITFIMFLGAIGMQLLRGESNVIDLWALASPFLLLLLPGMALIASVAVFFESVPILRGGLGNIIYFFIWIALISTLPVTVMLTEQSSNEILMFGDIFGWSIPLASMNQAIAAMYPGFGSGSVSAGFQIFEPPIYTFQWSGTEWSPLLLLTRVFWLLVAGLVAIAASVFFDRFDTAAILKSKKNKKGTVEIEEPKEHVKNVKELRLNTLLLENIRFGFLTILAAELRLMLKGQRWWWYTVSALLIVTGLFLPLDVSLKFILPVAWVWPILIWSSMGTRENIHNTSQLVFSAPNPVRNQLPATLLSGIIVAMVLGSGVLLHLIAAGSWMNVLAVLAGAVFAPSMALAMGVWTGNNRLFEIIYLLVWYTGPVNGVKYFDFLGTTARSVAMGIPVYFLAFTAILMILAVIGRKRQVGM
ncbi:hypothetical protein CUJ83_00350 [Methanocella sp. CWC-04]|uniref:Uncharacterized protein n=1 Tax=Methanooceanicella nereidis TaxID=2052831 RepID=A0AAP2R9E8_9EURY|nr:hypothetical protein [Methanocella sp. CWC-04]MCD1293448.1 hypothetical protein [Methanocella sp. CWC-04]